MKRWQKLLVLLLVLAICTQVPFIYRRYQLRRLRTAIQQINAQRQPQPDDGFVEYSGVIHVHSFLGGHSTGGFEEIIAAAQANRLSFVVMTEHTSNNFNTAAMTLKGVHGGVLFVNGNEVTTSNSDRLLVLPGDENYSGGNLSTQDELSKQKAKGARVFVAYPTEFQSWNTSGYDGVEVYNVFTNTRTINPLVMFFDGLWSYRSYPDLLFAHFYLRPNQNLSQWDQVIASGARRLVAIAGNDAHANVGISLNEGAGKRIAGVQLDPYERSFQLVRVHVLLPQGTELDSQALLNALGAGHCFIGFDVFGDTSGFSFSANKSGQKVIQGDEIKFESGLRLEVKTPASGRIVLLRNGAVIQDDNGISSRLYEIKGAGSYRVEVYLPQLPGLPGKQPWIISNPIYVRE